jgi:hypothetical protein
MTGLQVASGTQIWIPDDEVAWARAEIVGGGDQSDRVEVKVLGSSETRTIVAADVSRLAGTDARALPLCNLNLPDDGVPDLCDLTYLHEPAILHNLRLRSTAGLPYTYTGDICIAVNPYRWLDLYGDAKQQPYLERERRELPPHVYASSAHAYTAMRAHGANQSILVSGESGAGKTETVKILMNHLASISQAAAAADNSADGLGNGGGGTANTPTVNTTVSRVLQSNPLMETFGNAKTVRNDNSSRFGKFAQLQVRHYSRTHSRHFSRNYPPVTLPVTHIFPTRTASHGCSSTPQGCWSAPAATPTCWRSRAARTSPQASGTTTRSTCCWRSRRTRYASSSTSCLPPHPTTTPPPPPPAATLPATLPATRRRRAPIHTCAPRPRTRRAAA